jgi:putative membrane protein
VLMDLLVDDVSPPPMHGVAHPTKGRWSLSRRVERINHGGERRRLEAAAMMWRDGSWGWWWLVGLPLMVACMATMLWMMSHGHGSHDARTGGSPVRPSGDPKRILAERLARGEIDPAEYEQRLAVLQRSAGSPERS